MTTEIATKPEDEQREDAMKERVDRIQGAITDVLAPNLNSVTFMAVVLKQVRANLDLMDCPASSLMMAVHTCAQLGLTPGPELGLAYLIPFAKRVTVQIGYKGWVELAMRSPKVKVISAGVVYQDELDQGLFSATLMPADVHHGISFGTVNRGHDQLRVAYAMAELTSGAKVLVVLDRHQVEAHKAKAQGTGKASSPWKVHTDKMWRKTAIKDLLAGGLVPIVSEMAIAMQVDQGDEIAPDVTYTEPGQ